VVSLEGTYKFTKKNRYWSSENPHITHEVLLHPVKIGVRCGVSARRIVGPEFFNETIRKDIYRLFSSNFFLS
jgi:hypothetical protein